MRIDVWDVKKAEDHLPLDCGYPRTFADLFTVEQVIGQGGFGKVRVVVEKATGAQFACKSIKKLLDVPNISPEKQAQHLDNIDREIKVLKKLRGTLSVVHFKGSYEDDTDVHIVMEYCRGGELHHVIGQRVYTEETVAAYMRSVLQTLAQCHSHHILHRDVKPGNFMLLDDSEGAPLKAIDFGLAAFFDPAQLPRTDLGLDGTPWFMAPEVLNSQTLPASDVWSAGVMCYQLLSGYLPFDDTRNPNAPALSVIWRGILGEQPSFRRSAWQEVSQEAKDFVTVLLNKDPAQRPTAKEALAHCWLQTTFHTTKRRPLSATVVQRIQRYAQSNILRRTILELIASELLKIAPPKLSDGSTHGSSAAAAAAAASGGDEPSASSDGGVASPMSPSTVGDDSSHGGTVFAMSPDNKPTFLSPRRSATLGLPTGRRKSMELPLQSSGSLTSLGSVPRSPSLQQLATLDKAAVRRGAATVHGPGDYWRIMRQASELAAIGSGHGQFNYLRAAARSKEERQEQRKAARLSLDTSAHGGDRYHELLARLESEGHTRARKVSSGMRTSKSTGELRSSGQSLSSGGNTPGTSIPVAKDKDPRPEKAVGPKAPAPLLVPELSSGVGGTEPMDIDAQMEKGGRGRSAAMLALQAGDGSAPGGAPASETAQKASPVQPAAGASQPSAGSGPRTVKRVTFTGTQDSPASADDKKKTEGSDPAAAPALTSAASGLASGPITSTQELESLMRRLHFKSDKGLGRDALAEGLRHLGYDLAPSEVAVLMNELDLDASETVDASEFVASQIDWGAMQRSNRDLWLECAQRAFSDLDENADGHLSVQQLVTSLRRKLPSAEVDFALEDALVEAGLAQAEDIDFEGFLRMLHVGSVESLDSLDQYDPRLRASHLDTSMHGGPKLKPVLEDADDAQ